MYTTGPAALCNDTTRRSRFWLLDDLPDAARPQEHAMVLLTLEVSFPLDGAIVLAARLGKLYSDPVAGLEVGRSQEADCRDAIVV